MSYLKEWLEAFNQLSTGFKVGYLTVLFAVLFYTYDFIKTVIRNRKD